MSMWLDQRDPVSSPILLEQLRLKILPGGKRPEIQSVLLPD
jgi:hypothetical protein